jgi:hypothetical protein
MVDQQEQNRQWGNSEDGAIVLDSSVLLHKDRCRCQPEKIAHVEKKALARRVPMCRA